MLIRVQEMVEKKKLIKFQRRIVQSYLYSSFSQRI